MRYIAIQVLTADAWPLYIFSSCSATFHDRSFFGHYRSVPTAHEECKYGAILLLKVKSALGVFVYGFPSLYLTLQVLDQIFKLHKTLLAQHLEHSMVSALRMKLKARQGLRCPLLGTKNVTYLALRGFT